MIKSTLRKFYRKNYRFKKFKVLSRCACLGMRLIKEMDWEFNCVNHQKSRIDYILNYRTEYTPVVKNVLSVLKNKYIIGCIEQQQHNFFDYPKPDIIVMDSFSELTDQMFVNDQGRRFLANYTDVDMALNKAYKCEGLLDITELRSYYLSFFEKVKETYPAVVLIYIHFSSALDEREKFKHRAIKIEEIIQEMSCIFDFIKVVKIQDDLVQRANSKDDEFNALPYHYSDLTYQHYLGLFKNVCK